ncbi:hypothetical protein [Boseongicola aestuarii]|uniref:Uncharacterized protein n=1 Tax=Boseongicola aestuarii TaxID=1470561 RepID=A0A238J3R5_9RHOB|nr:hypothetical protein [Boseongicola aestuarii]SMX25296.1 hypothetical protein BOA8489_03435 [Boseongicola aestuarii]
MGDEDGLGVAIANRTPTLRGNASLLPFATAVSDDFLNALWLIYAVVWDLRDFV